MAESFHRVASCACGQVTLVLSRVEEHKTARGILPKLIVLHPHTFIALQDELRRRFGSTECLPNGRPAFYGVEIRVCQCGKYLQEDLLVAVDGDAEEI